MSESTEQLMVEPLSQVAPHVPDTGRDQPESPHSFLVCLDPRDDVASRRALDYAKLRLTRAGDLVVLCTVIPHPLMTSSALPSISSAATDQAVLRHEEDRVRGTAFSKLKEYAVGFTSGVKVDVMVSLETGMTTAEVIAAVCERYRCEMIVLGRRKHNPLQRWLGSGSVSTALLTNTDYSVLVVR